MTRIVVRETLLCTFSQASTHEGKAMPIARYLATVTILLLVTSSASGQIVRGVMTVTGAEMH